MLPISFLLIWICSNLWALLIQTYSMHQMEQTTMTSLNIYLTNFRVLSISFLHRICNRLSSLTRLRNHKLITCKQIRMERARISEDLIKCMTICLFRWVTKCSQRNMLAGRFWYQASSVTMVNLQKAEPVLKRHQRKVEWIQCHQLWCLLQGMVNKLTWMESLKLRHMNHNLLTSCLKSNATYNLHNLIILKFWSASKKTKVIPS